MAIKTVPRHDIPLNDTIRMEVMTVRLVHGSYSLCLFYKCIY